LTPERPVGTLESGMTRIVVLAVLLATLAAGTAHATSAPAGVAGRVFVDACPGPQRTGEGCLRPVALPVVIQRNGKVVLRTRSRADGRFRVGLRASRYTVKATAAGRPPRVASKTVSVPTRGYASVVLIVDLGIR
jgi:hypothetical protein